MEFVPHPHLLAEADELHRESPSVKVQLSHIRVTAQAQATLGMAVQEVSREFGLDTSMLIKRLKGEIYWRPETDSLMFVLNCPELEADMFVEIPEGHWSFREDTKQLH